jgi:hypothetical protein
MKLIDPTGSAPERSHARAPKLAALDGKVVGLISNGKLNADLLLEETAKLFVAEHGCRVNKLVYKHNASAPARQEVIQQVADESDFLLTATGD